MAPKKPITVITVSVFISGLCTGHSLSRSRIYRFPEIVSFQPPERSPTQSTRLPKDVLRTAWKNLPSAVTI